MPRQQLTKQDLTPAEAAEVMGSSYCHVMKLIHMGEVEAYDVSAGGKPRYKIPAKSITAFKERRKVKPVTAKLTKTGRHIS